MAGQRGIAGDDLDGGQIRLRRETAGHRGIARVEFNQPGGHVAAARVAGEDADQVAALASAEADRAYRARRGVVERGPDPVLHPGQSPGQAAAGIVVARVPGIPVPFGHAALTGTWSAASCLAARASMMNRCMGSETTRYSGTVASPTLPPFLPVTSPTTR